MKTYKHFTGITVTGNTNQGFYTENKYFLPEWLLRGSKDWVDVDEKVVSTEAKEEEEKDSLEYLEQRSLLLESGILELTKSIQDENTLKILFPDKTKERLIQILNLWKRNLEDLQVRCEKAQKLKENDKTRA